jgi:capsular exopolysaccharide synthesis family protein
MVDAVADLDPEALAREPYPLEMPERRQPSGRRPVAVPFTNAPTPPPKTEPVRPESPKPEGLLQRLDSALVEKVVIDRNTDGASREQYRRLAATLHHAQSANGIKVVLITSAVQGEGKSLTATNLAMTFSESYQRSVLLIDADLRRPTLHTLFHVDNAGGLSEGLVSREQRRLPVRQVSARLAILPAGQPSADPMAGLTSDRMRQLVGEAREAFDWVIIDTPPVGLLPDANLLASIADAAVLVIKAESTSYDLVNRALTALGRDRVLGVVLNSSHTMMGADYGDYGGYYGAFDDSGDHSQ